MKVAVTGCVHGQLNTIYDAISIHDSDNHTKTELVICTGDFQSCRDDEDLESMACPQKYRQMGDFQEYFNGIKEAPILTIFVGGNHEASKFLQCVYYGGWVAKNIFFMGYSGVVRVHTSANEVLRIGGLSGIYNVNDFSKGYFETYPFNRSTIRSCYHVRSFEVEKLKLLKEPVDVFFTHDWPTDVAKCGNIRKLLSQKPFLKDDFDRNQLGNPSTNILIQTLKPSHWFSSHLHVKYRARVKHGLNSYTEFLALDKPKLRRNTFIEFLNINSNPKWLKDCTTPPPETTTIFFDIEWLSILKSCEKLIPISCEPTFSVTYPLSYPSSDIFSYINEHLNSSLKWIDWDDEFKNPENQKKKFLAKTGLSLDLLDALALQKDYLTQIDTKHTYTVDKLLMYRNAYKLEDEEIPIDMKYLLKSIIN